MRFKNTKQRKAIMAKIRLGSIKGKDFAVIYEKNKKPKLIDLQKHKKYIPKHYSLDEIEGMPLPLKKK